VVSHYLGSLLRGLFACLLFSVAWLAHPKTVSSTSTTMNNRLRVQRITCISHGCVLWEGHHLDPDEIKALQAGHTLAHFNRPVTPHDLFEREPDE